MSSSINRTGFEEQMTLEPAETWDCNDTTHTNTTKDDR
jgi:hypothetical protein